jgi:hypothetical protein
MGLIGKILSFVRQMRNGANVSDVKSTIAGKYPVTPEHYSSPGDDSHPLPGDYDFLVPTKQKGRMAAVGYVDPNNTQAAQAGEKRIYARDSSGVEIVQLHLKNDGEATLFNDETEVLISPAGDFVAMNSIISVDFNSAGTLTADNGVASVEINISGQIDLSNAAGSIQLLANGNIVLNGVVITPAGGITAPNSLVLNGKELDGHDHPAGTPPGNTGPNN